MAAPRRIVCKYFQAKTDADAIAAMRKLWTINHSFNKTAECLRTVRLRFSRLRETISKTKKTVRGAMGCYLIGRSSRNAPRSERMMR
jgi:hypothetical protein